MMAPIFRADLEPTLRPIKNYKILQFLSLLNLRIFISCLLNYKKTIADNKMFYNIFGEF